MSRMFRSALIVALFCAPGAEAAPSFDCKAAKEEVEKIICKNGELSDLDLRIDAAYRGALKRLAGRADLIAALRENQRSFLDARDKALGINPEDAVDLMKTHRSFLDSIAPRAPGDFLGVWEQVGGVVIVRKGKKGGFAVLAETMRDPVYGNGMCDDGGDFRREGDALVSINEPKEWGQRLTRKGGLLELTEIEPRKRDPARTIHEPDYCGANGSLAGLYLPVRGPKPSYGDTIQVEAEGR